MTSAAFQILTDRTGPTIALSGDWTSLTLGEEALGLRAALGDAKGPSRIELKDLGRLDTAGAYAILSAIHPSQAPAAAPDRPDITRLFDLVRPAIEEDAGPQGEDRHGIFERVGRGLYAFADETYRASAFVGHMVMALARTARHPSRLRGISVTRVMETAGLDALPIILVMNFFIGTVVALVGANLLSGLGVAVFTVELVGVAVLREFAILFTAILLAGRSASSFAAQIGSMKMNQETDAMQVMGVDQFDALVVPRVLALLWMMPLLTFAGMIAGITGGLLISWAALDMSPQFFLERMHTAVPIRHFWIGLSKAPLLAILIAMAGCRHGLFVGGDVESLGQRVTRAVVQAIFMIIFFDAVFALIFMKLHL